MFHEIKVIDGLLSARRSPEGQWTPLGPLHHLKRLAEDGLHPDTLRECAGVILMADTDTQLWACRMWTALHPET